MKTCFLLIARCKVPLGESKSWDISGWEKKFTSQEFCFSSRKVIPSHFAWSQSFLLDSIFLWTVLLTIYTQNLIGWVWLRIQLLLHQHSKFRESGSRVLLGSRGLQMTLLPILVLLVKLMEVPEPLLLLVPEFGPQMAPLALVPNLATRWYHLHLLKIWPPDGATGISSKFVHQVAPLGCVTNLATRWHHCMSWKIGHKMALLGLVANFPTSLSHLHCHIALECPIGIIS